MRGCLRGLAVSVATEIALTSITLTSILSQDGRGGKRGARWIPAFAGKRSGKGEESRECWLCKGLQDGREGKRGFTRHKEKRLRGEKTTRPRQILRRGASSE